MKYLALLLFLPFTAHAQCTLPQVTNFDVTNVTSTSADLHWVTTGQFMNIQYQHGTEIQNTVGPSTAGATLYPLVPNSVYTFRIQPFNDCGVGDWTTVVKSTPPLVVGGGLTQLPRTGNDQSDNHWSDVLWGIALMAVGYLIIRKARRM